MNSLPAVEIFVQQLVLCLCFERHTYTMQVLRELDKKEEVSLHLEDGCKWHPEYGSWMVEGTPREPFSGCIADLEKVSIPVLFCGLNSYAYSSRAGRN